MGPVSGCPWNTKAAYIRRGVAPRARGEYMGLSHLTHVVGSNSPATLGLSWAGKEGEGIWKRNVILQTQI